MPSAHTVGTYAVVQTLGDRVPLFIVSRCHHQCRPFPWLPGSFTPWHPTATWTARRGLKVPNTEPLVSPEVSSLIMTHLYIQLVQTRDLEVHTHYLFPNPALQVG